MKVYFKRTGGLAAISLSVVLDTVSLSKADSERICKLIDAISFFDQPDLFISSIPDVDRFHYEIMVESEGRVKSIKMDESAVPDFFRPLLEHLIKMARVKKK